MIDQIATSINWGDWMIKALLWGAIFTVAKLASDAYYRAFPKTKDVSGPVVMNRPSSEQVVEIVGKAKQRFTIESNQMNRSLYQCMRVSPSTIRAFIDDMEHEMNLVPRSKIDIKTCSVEDIIRALGSKI